MLCYVRGVLPSIGGRIRPVATGIGRQIWETQQRYARRAVVGNVARKSESYRGNPARRVDRRRGKTLGQIRQEEAKARAQARTRPQAPFRPDQDTRRSVLTVPGIRARAAPFGGVAAAGNELVSIYTDIWFRQREWRQRIERLAGREGARRGAAATRPLSTSAIPGRTGAAATRRPEAVIAQQPAARTATGTDRAAQQLPARQPAVARAPAAVPGTARAPATAPAQARALFRLPNLGEMLANALAPRTAPRPVPQSARVLAPLPARVSIPRMGANATPGLTPGLTPSNSPMLGFSQALDPNANPEAEPELDPCEECKKVKKKSQKPRCVNPVVSRSVRDGIRTTKTRLLCP